MRDDAAETGAYLVADSLGCGQPSGQPLRAELCWLSGNGRLHNRRRSELAGYDGPRVVVAGTPVSRTQRLAQPGPWPFGTLISSLKTAEQVEPEDVESVPCARDRSQPWLPRRNAVRALAGATSAPAPSPRTFLEHETEVVLATARFADSFRPHANRCITAPASALLHSLAARFLCAFGASQSSVAPGARLTAASCSHTLVSAIRRAAGLRGGAVRVARRTIVRNQVGGRGPGRSGRCSGC